MSDLDIDFSKALFHLVPNAQWAMDDNDFANILWLSDDINQPTIAQLKTAYVAYLATLDK
jgi:hypothetical protein